MHRKQIPAFLIALALASTVSTQAWAQDVIVDFVKEGTANSKRQSLVKGDDVTFEFLGNEYQPYGAYIYCDWDVYKLIISAPRNIAVIEYQVTPVSGKDANLVAYPGTISTKDADTRIWRGSTNKITFTGTSYSTSCSITRLRLWYNAADYNPDASWEVDESSNNPYAADVNLAEDDTDYTKKDRVYASANVLPRDGHGVPMAVVSDRKFQQTLQSYLEWKTQQGYEVQELYTDQLPGKRGTELAYAIRERLMAMDPRPAYVLLVGDIEEIPSFPGVGAADLYYGEYTNDYYPEAYVGRFSASNVEQLQPQLDKTRYMAFLSPNEGEWLKHSLTINGISEDIAVMKPAAELSVKYPLNFEGNTSRETSASSTSIKIDIDNGCSYVSYFGHGGPGQWGTNFSNSNVYSYDNKNKYPLVFSMTCHAGNFAYNQQCLAEAFMQRKDAGAVAVIAATRPSRSDSNYRRFFGDKDGSQSASVGLLRSLFPCVGVEPSQRARTIGQALEISGLAVARNMHDDFVDNTEMYNLLGDPTYQPYITTPKANKLSASSYYIKAGQNVTVTTVPDAMVCLSQGRKVIAAAMAGTDGKAVLHVPAATTLSGDCTLYTSAPGYNDLSRIVTLSAGNGTEEQLDGTAKADPRITHTDVISLATAGNAISADWYGPQPLASSTSSARYLVCAVNDKSDFANGVTGNSHWLNSSSTPAEGIFLRNHHAPCSIVTTASPGKARRVSIDWLHPAGQGEVIGVYGSNTPYTETTEAWNGDDWNGTANGTKLGELVKGYNDELIIDGDYKYLLFRAEPHKQFPTVEQSNVFIKSLTIGWEANLPQCTTPQIALEGGKFRFSCSTPNATYRYGVAPAQTAGKFVLTVTAEANGYKPSAAATLTFDGRELAKLSGDLDANGTLSITDVVKLINTLSPKK